MPNALKVLQMSEELVLLERLFVRTGWVFAESWIERLVPFELLAHAHSMLVKVTFMIVVDRLLKEFILFRAVWVGTSSRVDRFSFLALDNE